MNKNMGFTLVELMIAIAVIGILIGAVAPGFTAWVENEKFISCAQDVQSVFQRAKTSAINEHSKVIVKISTDGSGSCHAFVDDDGGTTGVYDPGEKEIVPETSISTGGELDYVSFKGEWGEATRFNTMGMSVGYDGVVVLKNENVITPYRRIVVSAAGNIKMEKSADGTNWHDY